MGSTGDIELTPEELAKREEAAAGYKGPDRVIDNIEFWDIEKRKSRSPERIYKSGLPTLDSKTEGFESGEVWAVTGPAKHGKTTLCDTIGRNISRNGTNVLWFSFEMSPRKFLAKYKAADAPVIYIPLKLVPNTLDWIEVKVLEAKVKFDCRVVFIDHLHFIADMRRLMQNSSLEIGLIMRFLKQRIAIQHNVCVFLVAHMTKATFGKNEEPSADDIRDSSFVKQEADGSIVVYRKAAKGKKATDDEPFGNKARIIIDNARRSGVMRVRINAIKVGDDLVEEAIGEELEPPIETPLREGSNGYEPEEPPVRELGF